jgi:hypothetical protein
MNETMLMQAKTHGTEMEREAAQARRATRARRFARARRSPVLPSPPGSRPWLATAFARLRPTIAGR